MGRDNTIVVTGMGTVSALGHGNAAFLEALEAGRDGLAPITRFSTEGFRARLGGMVPGVALSGGESCRAFAVEAALEALQQAGPSSGPASRLALVLGSCIGHDFEDLDHLTQHVAERVGAEGPRLTVSTACSSSTNAIGLGKELLERGEADRVLAGGADALNVEVFAGFHALGVLSEQKCAPFSEPVGTTLGEGAGFLVLERRADALDRGARPLATILGYGLSADAHHATSPDPTGAGTARALRSALADAATAPEAVDYVNAHGTGTEVNDAAEWRALQKIFGPRSEQLPVSSTKSYLGHAQGAAGALELCATLMLMGRGTIPPTLHGSRPRPRCPTDTVSECRPRVHRVGRAASLNAAFGGANAAVVVGDPLQVGRAAGAPRAVFVDGVGTVGDGRGRVPEFRLEELCPMADTRGLDPSARFLTAAAARALREAGLTLRGEARDRAGIFAAAVRTSPKSGREFHSSIEVRGLHRLSAMAFPRIVLNASAGVCAHLLSLRGPTTTLTTGRASGLVAIACAARHLAWRADADCLLAGAVDEVDPGTPAETDEGAACLALVAGPPGRSGVRLAGHALAGPGQVAQAVARARAEAGVESTDRVIEVAPSALASTSAFACAAAFAALRRGEGGSVLVADAGGGSASGALVMVAQR